MRKILILLIINIVAYYGYVAVSKTNKLDDAVILDIDTDNYLQIIIERRDDDAIKRVAQISDKIAVMEDLASLKNDIPNVPLFVELPFEGSKKYDDSPLKFSARYDVSINANKINRIINNMPINIVGFIAPQKEIYSYNPQFVEIYHTIRDAGKEMLYYRTDNNKYLDYNDSVESDIVLYYNVLTVGALEDIVKQLESKNIVMVVEGNPHNISMLDSWLVSKKPNIRGFDE